MEYFNFPKLARKSIMKNKILICHNTCKTLLLHYEKLIYALVQSGDDVICVTPYDDSVKDLIELGAIHKVWDISQHGLNPLREFMSILGLSKIIKDTSPDIFLGITIKPNLYGSLVLWKHNTKKRFYMMSGLGYVFIGNSAKQKILRFVIKSFFKLTFRRANAVLFQNSDDAEDFVSNGLITQEQSVTINGTGIETNKFIPNYRISTNNTNISFILVARVLRDKGVYEYVDAARIVLSKTDKANFSILGPLDDNPSGVQMKEIDSWEHEGVIKYLGVTKNVQDYLKVSDVFVLPSYREGLSRATLEAMATGMPIITTDVPGCRQTVIDGHNGFMVPKSDSIALSKAMLSFINDKTLINKMGRESRMMAIDKYDMNNVVNSIIKCLLKD